MIDDPSTCTPKLDMADSGFLFSVLFNNKCGLIDQGRCSIRVMGSRTKNTRSRFTMPSFVLQFASAKRKYGSRVEVRFPGAVLVERFFDPLLQTRLHLSKSGYISFLAYRCLLLIDLTSSLCMYSNRYMFPVVLCRCSVLETHLLSYLYNIPENTIDINLNCLNEHHNAGHGFLWWGEK